MTISQQQFDALEAMGIPLWQRNDFSADNSGESSTAQVKASEFLPIDFSVFSEFALFQDVLIALDLSIGEVKFSEQTLDLGFINWHFSSAGNVALDQGNLITPTIEKIISNPSLKKALWLAIAEHGAAK